MGRIEIERRARGSVDVARKYKVVIDGEERAAIGRGEKVLFDLEPGQHTVMLRIDWARSPQVTLSVREGETVRLSCEPAANPVTALWYTTFGRSRYIRLRPTEAAGAQ